MHRILFALGPGENLSSMAELPKLHTLLVLTAGGLVVGLTYLYQTRRPHPIVDPIEANALHGGRMSLTDSVLVSLQSLLSCGFGLSLGIEGGFTQAAGAVGSKVGRLLKRRRHDVRMPASAQAPRVASQVPSVRHLRARRTDSNSLSASYTVATLPPVVAAAVAGTLAAHTFVGHTYHVHLEKLNRGPTRAPRDSCRSWHRMRSAFGRADARRDGDGTPIPPQRLASRTARRTCWRLSWSAKLPPPPCRSAPDSAADFFQHRSLSAR